MVVPEQASHRGVLNKAEICRRIALGVDNPLHLDVVPFDPDAVQGSSLDVCLGNRFATARETSLACVEIGNKTDEQKLMTRGRERFFLDHGRPFIIHPGSFVLGTTLEFISLPTDLMAFVEGRSRIGRMGLIVATATQIGPGFHGVLILELANTGTVPLKISPGIPIAQLVFLTLTAPAPAYDGSSDCQIEP